MSHTFTQLLYHIVFGTRNRAALIDPGLRDDLYPYIAGIVRNERGSLLAIGGMPDHLHLLVRLKPAVSLSDLLCSVKASSSGWVHERPDPPRGGTGSNSIRQIRSAEAKESAAPGGAPERWRCSFPGLTPWAMGLTPSGLAVRTSMSLSPKMTAAADLAAARTYAGTTGGFFLEEDALFRVTG